MPSLPKSLFWVRTDTAGAEHAVCAEGDGLIARGVAVAVDPISYTCRYQVTTGPDGATRRVEVEAEGAGWQRGVRLEPTGARWRVRTSEQGDLDAALRAAGHPAAGLPGSDDPDRLTHALDVDLAGSPLFNTLAIRRLGLATATPRTAHRITVVWVLVPSLAVVAAEQVYTALGPELVRFSSESFAAELELDPEGWVIRYPGLAERVTAR